MNISHKVLPMPSIEAQEEVARQVVDGYVPGKFVGGAETLSDTMRLARIASGHLKV
jgi:hypothetical protein